MRNGGTRIPDRSRSFPLLLVLAALTVAAVCPRGALATLRLVSLGDARPAPGVGSEPEIGEPRTEVVVAVAPLIRRRMLSAPAPPLPVPDTDAAAPLATAVILAVLLASSVLPLRRSLPHVAGFVLARRDRAPPLLLGHTG